MIGNISGAITAGKNPAVVTWGPDLRPQKETSPLKR
jgi:hypothetical protein